MPKSVAEGFVNFAFGFNQQNVVLFLSSQVDTFGANFKGDLKKKSTSKLPCASTLQLEVSNNQVKFLFWGESSKF